MIRAGLRQDLPMLLLNVWLLLGLAVVLQYGMSNVDWGASHTSHALHAGADAAVAVTNSESNHHPQ
jgi:hypothetical protein